MLSSFIDVKKNDLPSSDTEDNEFDLFPTTTVETPKKTSTVADDPDYHSYDMIKESTALKNNGVKLIPGQLFFASCAIFEKNGFLSHKALLPPANSSIDKPYGMIFKKKDRFCVVSYACSDNKKDKKTPHIKTLMPYIYTLVRKYLQPGKFSPSSEEEESTNPFVIIKKPPTISYYYIVALSHYGRKHYVHIAIEDGKINFYCTVPGLDWLYWGNHSIETIIKATHGQDLKMAFHRDKCQLNGWECGLHALDMIMHHTGDKDRMQFSFFKPSYKNLDIAYQMVDQGAKFIENLSTSSTSANSP